jgi:signal peptide peptidase SppA
MLNQFNHNNASFWLGTPASYETVISAQVKIQEHSLRHHYDDDEEDSMSSPILSISEGIATVMVHGSLTSEDSFFNQMFGITSYNEIRNAIIEAVGSMEVSRIVLDIDSPGGSAKGIDDLGDFIKFASTRMPIVAHVSGEAFSAACWIATSCDSITGSRMSQHGSIGVIAVLQEMTKMAENEGIKFHVFRAGKYKAIGNPYEELAEESREIIQAQVDTIEGFFLDAISENRSISRGSVKSQVGEGLTFFAAEAVDKGLLDEVLSIQDLLTRLISLSNSNPRGLNASTEETSMATKALTAKASAALAAGASDEEINALLSAASEEELTAEQIAANLAAAKLEGEGLELTAEQIAANLAAEGEGAQLTAEELEIKAAADLAAAAPAVAAVDNLVTYLKEENQTLRQKITGLESDSLKLAELNTMIPQLKAALGEYVSGMSVRLGGSHLDTSSLELPSLIAQYTSTRTAMLKRYPVGGKASVDDSASDNSDADAATVTYMRSVKSNTI